MPATVASGYFSFSCATALSADACVLAVSMTFAPSFRNLSAVAKPMPLLPPVMMATLSFSLILRTSFLFDDYIIPNFNPHDRDKITMPKIIVDL